MVVVELGAYHGRSYMIHYKRCGIPVMMGGGGGQLGKLSNLMALFNVVWAVSKNSFSFTIK